jgi:hypothetical protein
MSASFLNVPMPRPEWGSMRLGWTDVEGAGAIHSFEWPVNCAFKPAIQFVNDDDDGRFIQSAVVLDNDGVDPERLNPTEGGSSAAPAFLTPSKSRLLQQASGPNWMETTCRMAYWKPVGGKVLSNFNLTKRVTLDWNAIVIDLSLSTPETETYTKLQWELDTGYMPSQFSKFEAIDKANRKVLPLDDTPGEQQFPVMFSTPDGEYAMGVYVPAGTPGGGYGRWRFTAIPPFNFPVCVKWNAVRRTDNPVPGDQHKARVIVPFGSRADVIQTMLNLP